MLASLYSHILLLTLWNSNGHDLWYKLHRSSKDILAFDPFLRLSLEVKFSSEMDRSSLLYIQYSVLVSTTRQVHMEQLWITRRHATGRCSLAVLRYFSRLMGTLGISCVLWLGFFFALHVRTYCLGSVVLTLCSSFNDLRSYQVKADQISAFFVLFHSTVHFFVWQMCKIAVANVVSLARWPETRDGKDEEGEKWGWLLMTREHARSPCSAFHCSGDIHLKLARKTLASKKKSQKKKIKGKMILGECSKMYIFLPWQRFLQLS